MEIVIQTTSHVELIPKHVVTRHVNYLVTLHSCPIYLQNCDLNATWTALVLSGPYVKMVWAQSYLEDKLPWTSAMGFTARPLYFAIFKLFKLIQKSCLAIANVKVSFSL